MNLHQAIQVLQALADSSSSEDDIDVEHLQLLNHNQRQTRTRIVRYTVDMVPLYSPEEFQSHFRVSRGMVTKLEELFAREMKPNAQLSQRDQILLSLWMLANKDVYRETADRFNVSISTAWNLFMNFCYTCASKAGEFVTWPADVQKSKREFQNMAGFPDVVGCIDGTHIQTSTPTKDGHRFINRKGFPSMVLLAVCDDRMRFTWVNVGWPGSVHDSRIYRNELLPVLEEQGHVLLPGNGHILGDAAFPLSKWLLTPFRDNGHLSRDEQMYNTKLSSTRMTVERSFGRLKAKFRRLQRVEMRRHDLLPNIILTACVLHNLSIDEDVSGDEQGDEKEDDQPDQLVLAVQSEVARATDGDIKRARVVEQLALAGR